MGSVDLIPSLMNAHIPLLTCIAALAASPLVSRAATVGVNFIHADYVDNTGVQSGETAMGIPGASWTNFPIRGTGVATEGAGTGVAGGLNVAWNAANAWDAGSEGILGNDASQQVFRVYLDDADGGNSYFDGDNYGVSVQVSGLSAFLATSGATTYSVTLYFSTDSAALRTAEVRAGLLTGTPSASTISSLSLLGSIAPQSPLGNGTYPTGPIPGGDGTGGSRGIGTLDGLNADAITIAIPRNDGTGPRGSLAGFSINAVPEPSVSVMLGGLGLAGLLRRRRR